MGPKYSRKHTTILAGSNPIYIAIYARKVVTQVTRNLHRGAEILQEPCDLLTFANSAVEYGPVDLRCTHLTFKGRSHFSRNPMAVAERFRFRRFVVGPKTLGGT